MTEVESGGLGSGGGGRRKNRLSVVEGKSSIIFDFFSHGGQKIQAPTQRA
jgi:hypothetical protein